MDRVLDFSEEFVLSAGTIPIDTTKNLILCLYSRSKSEYMLPKGRKNIGETLEAAATRETFEETGYECRILQHNLPTKATGARDAAGRHTEPIAIQQRLNSGTRKIIFWYLGAVDSTQAQVQHSQEAHEDFVVRWVALDEAAAVMSFEDDRKIVEKAIKAVSPASTPGVFPAIDYLRS